MDILCCYYALLSYIFITLKIKYSENGEVLAAKGYY